MNYEQDYLDLVNLVLRTGTDRQSRAGDTVHVFGTVLQVHGLSAGKFPVLTTRKMHLPGIVGELAAFIRGTTTVAGFKDLGCNYWDANAAAWVGNKGVPVEKHRVGNIYGAKWRNFYGVDQLERLVYGLKFDPLSRRHLLTTYDPSETFQCLPPCHLLAQFNVTNDAALDCIVYMRSVDLILGLPSDVVLYSLLLALLAKECRYKTGNLVFMMGDTHIYKNHIEQFVQPQLKRVFFEAPQFVLNQDTNLFSFQPSDLSLIDYKYHDSIKYSFNV